MFNVCPNCGEYSVEKRSVFAAISPRAWAGLECEWTVSIRENGPLHSIREPACGTLGHLEVSRG